MKKLIKVLLVIFTIVWVTYVAIQFIYWMTIDVNTVAAAFWATVELLIPAFIYWIIREKDE